jgi:phage tail sheath protein FI
VEEVPSANKPIEGASTSTAAMVGLAARGPVNTPTLTTSAGSFTRLFGGLLDPRVFTDGLDSMPQAAFGFFANGGSRLYVTRIVGDNASFASTSIWGDAAGATAGVTLIARAGAGDSRIAISDDTDIAAGKDFVISDGVASETVQTMGAAAQTLVVLAEPVTELVANAATVKKQTIVPGAAQAGFGDMAAGGGLVFTPTLALAVGTVLRIQDTVDTDKVDYVTIKTLNTNDMTQPGLVFDHPAATTTVDVVTLTPAASGGKAEASPAGSGSLWVDDASSLAAGDLAGIATATGFEYRLVTGTPKIATLKDPLAYTHASGTPIGMVSRLMQVHARYPGGWGNALVVRAVPVSLLNSTMKLAAGANALSLSLNSTFGLFAGSALQLGTGGSAQLVTVKSVNRTKNEVTLESPLGTGVGLGDAVASREFNLFVDRYENDKVVESEQFEGLALHPAHARYAPKAVGAFDRASDTSADSGASELVRVSDRAKDDSGTDLPGADVLRQSAPVGSSFHMTGGDDDLASIDDNSFIGDASDDPHLRTGIQAMENENSLSIVAVPGRTSVPVQNALLEHCEKMRYRFAVIEPPAGSKIAEARAHRQNFDSTRGAIYYPWLDVPDPVGAPGDLIRIPPSGHVMGIYARTDVARGVWKAPANEVVRGIVQLDTALTKGEQDILNPVHVNCFRDFRSVNRGLRLYGARTLSSDPEFRYINVRRTLLYIEQSLDTGLQWAVFEPNAEPLWASVKQSVTGFLRTLWRDGGLEGTSEEEAFFVNIGYDVTMTQADIDNGRMIVVIGVAIVKPAEFVIVRISQKTRDAKA